MIVVFPDHTHYFLWNNSIGNKLLVPFTVRHFLLECGEFAQVRNNCFHVENIKQLFQDIHIDSIVTFLKEINLLNKIESLFLSPEEVRGI